MFRFLNKFKIIIFKFIKFLIVIPMKMKKVKMYVKDFFLKLIGGLELLKGRFTPPLLILSAS